MTRSLTDLCNIGKAALADFAILNVTSVEDLATRDADTLYVALCQATNQRHDPCVHDVLTAAIHQARTGEALDWWHFTAARKTRQQEGCFPDYTTVEK
ncbi:helix-hairpin-helix domain-containing protein [Acetobacter indonesiensis]|uniref:helix-hairpin-helix domain-containing protein n=1 Tax=Acetobacter indonesiensis TaxID=104101 RepID=UPI0020A25DE6|nr:helix-hairpin-helix domain-containing protein [Acetobacter indonesiensis]MCP1229621.1 helix-hairpin-helix domain-containing protein [Acetobacter indonesiensis]